MSSLCMAIGRYKWWIHVFHVSVLNSTAMYEYDIKGYYLVLHVSSTGTINWRCVLTSKKEWGKEYFTFRRWNKNKDWHFLCTCVLLSWTSYCSYFVASYQVLYFPCSPVSLATSSKGVKKTKPLPTTTTKSPAKAPGASLKSKAKKSYWTTWINEYDPYEKGAIGDVEQRTLMQPVSIAIEITNMIFLIIKYMYT